MGNTKLKSGVYFIQCTKTKKVYIGSSNNLNKRFNNHKVELRQNSHCNRHLQRAFNKYGEKAFKFRVLENCSINKLLDREQFYIDLFRAYKKGFNLSPYAGRTIVTIKERKKRSQRAFGNKWSLGYKHTIEAKNRISTAHLGNKHRLGKHSKKHSKTVSGKGNSRYIDGSCLKRNKCIDCGKKLSKKSFYHKTKRCYSCANKGKNNPAYKKKYGTRLL